MKTLAAILAGGSGLRVGGETPKQLLPLRGKPVLSHCIAAFDAHPGIDGVVVVCREDLIPAIETLVRAEDYTKVLGVIPGGADRSGSSVAAIRFAKAWQQDAETQDVKLLLHDAARPLVDAGIISRCLEALERFEAVEAVAPATDTIVRRSPDGLLEDVLPRDQIALVQTPQGFRLKVIAEAYRRAMEDPAFTATDDCSVVRRYLPRTPVRLVEGSPRNIKLTYPTDLPVLEALMGTKDA